MRLVSWSSSDQLVTAKITSFPEHSCTTFRANVERKNKPELEEGGGGWGVDWDIYGKIMGHIDLSARDS